MNREELKALGLTDEQVDSVMKSYGKATNEIKGKADKVDALESQIADYKQQITDRDNQLTELKKVDGEGLQAEITRLEGLNETTASDYKNKLDSQAKDFAIETALRDAKARNPKIAKTALDVDLITFKDGKLVGVDEQLTAIKESDAYLFESEEDNTPPGIKGRKPKEGEGKDDGIKNPFSDDTFNLTEQGRLSVDDPELYKQLKAQAGK